MILLVIFFKAEDVVKSTMKYIPEVMFDRRERMSVPRPTTYIFIGYTIYLIYIIFFGFAKYF